MNKNYPLSIDYQSQAIEQYYVIFTVNNIKYAINIQNVIEIINIPYIEIAEKTPKGVIGFFNYNDKIIKAVDLSPFLGFTTLKFSISDKMIVLFVNDEYFAVHTKNIEAIIKLDNSNIQNIPYNLETSILHKIYKTQDCNINIINCNNLYKLLLNENTLSEIDYSELFENDKKIKYLQNFYSNNHIKAIDSFSFPINPQTSKQYILFTLDDKYYYLDIKYIKEFISTKRLNITKLPYSPDYILGLVSVKGEFLVTVNLKKFIGENQNNKNSDFQSDKLIIVEGKNFDIAFLVDDIKSIKNLSDVKKYKVSSNTYKYIYAEFIENNILYSILDFDEIINDERLYINIE